MGKISDVLDKFENEHESSERRLKMRKQVPNKTAPFQMAPGATGAKLTNYRRLDSNLVTIFKPQSFEAEQFRMLKSQLLIPTSNHRVRTIMVTSALPGEGKSFVSSNLAVSLAQNINEHVLLVDCDIRKPTIHSSFGIAHGPGLSDYLSNDISLSSLLLETDVKKLKILPGGSRVRNPSELLSSQKMVALCHELTSRYSDRYIVIDSPPPELTSETKVISRHVDGIFLVVKYRSTPRKLVADLVESLGKKKIIGLILNMCDFKSASYNYKKYGRYTQYYESNQGK